MRLRAYVEQHQLGRVMVEVGSILERSPDTVRGPDIAFIAAEHLHAGGPRRGFVPGAPDLAVEIVSPNNTFAELQSKVRDYLTHGTRLVWVVEPDSCTMVVYHPDGRELLLGGTMCWKEKRSCPGSRLRWESFFNEEVSVWCYVRIAR